MTQTNTQTVTVNGLAYTLNPYKHTATLSIENSKNPALQGTMNRVQIPIEECDVREVKKGSITMYVLNFNGEEYNLGPSKPEFIMPKVLMSHLIELHIPESIVYDGEEYTVTVVGDTAFRFCNVIESVSLPKTIDWIRDYAFCGCQNLRSMVLHSDVAFGGYKPESILYSTPLTDIYYHARIEDADNLHRFISNLRYAYKENLYSNTTIPNPKDITVHVFEDTDLKDFVPNELSRLCQVIADIKK